MVRPRRIGRRIDPAAISSSAGRGDQAALLAKAHRMLPVINPVPADAIVGYR
jgi:hypothetical protein